MKNSVTIQQRNFNRQRVGSISEILLSLPVWVRLPVRITLWLQPGNTLLNSVEEPVKLSITPQELRSIEASITQQHLTVEAALMAYLKQEMRTIKQWQELRDQVRQRYGQQADITIDVELLEKITWNG
jgi:hypothetical protein